MDKIIVYLDELEFAKHHLVPMKSTAAGGAGTPTHWILVACPPRLTRHVSQWVHQSARASWRARWAASLLARIQQELMTPGDIITPVVAQGCLTELTRELQSQHGICRVLDARRPKFGQEMAPVTLDQPTTGETRWAVPGAVAGMGAALLLAAE
jgi:hypothetical protein